MAHLLVMPRQGNSVESCILLDWKVAEGDAVEAATVVCEVETDKATFEVPAGADGMLLKQLHEAGADVPVLQPIAVIGAAGEDWQTAVADAGTAPATATTDAAGASTTAQPPDQPAQAVAASGRTDPAAPADAAPAAAGRVKSSPRARGTAAKLGVDLAPLAGTGPEGRVIERDVRSAAERQPGWTAAAATARDEAAAAPAAGSGLGGRVTFDDLRRAAQTPEGPAPAAPADPLADFPGATLDRPIQGVRKRIAARMLESLNTTAQFTLHAAADASALQRLRSRLKTSPETLALRDVTINDLLLCLVARLLPSHPELNAHKHDEAVRLFERVHLGVAVDTPRGLMVPVLRNADQRTLTDLAAETRRLGAACRDGRITPDELKGSTFTVTNLGALGVESFTPVLNTPEVAILGVGGITPRPLLDDAGELLRFAPHLGLSLTINHQVVDGAPAARFLKALRDALAELDLWLLR